MQHGDQAWSERPGFESHLFFFNFSTRENYITKAKNRGSVTGKRKKMMSLEHGGNLKDRQSGVEKCQFGISL